MGYEVEQKYRVEDGTAVERQVQTLGSELGDWVVQIDQYFAHPSRDYAATDEAFRIRRVGHRNWVTYKGPKLDATSKTRKEIELPLPDRQEGADRFAELLDALGFRPVATVEKKRRHATVTWEGRRCEIALDQVEQLGTFVELEFYATDDDLPRVRASLQTLADHWGLKGTERRSYLELLLEARARMAGA
jgi:adenylate cyclase, class 2